MADFGPVAETEVSNDSGIFQVTVSSIQNALPEGTNNIGSVDINTIPDITLAGQANPFTSDINVSLDGEVASVNINDEGDLALETTQVQSRDILNAIASSSGIKKIDDPITLASQVSPFTDDIKVSLDGEVVDTSVPKVVSSGNSTSTALSASGVFTGEWENPKSVSVISVLIHSDQPSADKGIELQFSADGINTHDDDKYTYTSEEVNNGKFFTLSPEASYFRVVYTNGATAQNNFTLHVIYHKVYVKPSSHRLAEILTDEADAELVKAVVTGKKPDGFYGDISLSDTGRVRISTEPPQAPSNTTAVDIATDGTVSGNSSIENFHLIPNGETLVIHSFNGGGAAATDGHTVELFDDPNGNGVGMSLIRVAFIGQTGGNFAFDLNFSVTGDGTRGIRVRRTRLGGGSARVAAFWSGYEG